jgi:aspartyl-tRNA(Asn)/glutamyl-tRNA(Gln) amidotransferase subunit A
MSLPLTDVDLAYLGIAELGEHLRALSLSPVDLCRLLLDRCARLEPLLNAFLALDAERILAEAGVAERELAGGHVRGPLHGVPIAVKDVCRTRGERTTAGSPLLAELLNRGNQDEDAVVVARLRTAGAVIFGKTNMPELAYGVTSHYPYGPSRNPWDPDRFPGGSSMGSAVAVSAGLVPGALGTDTGGSIRAPAHWCGVTGLKPTWGRVPLRGVVPQAVSLDHVGPITRSARDAALLLATVAGFDADDPTSAPEALPDYPAALAEPVSTLRVGVPRVDLWGDLTPGVGRACEGALQELGQLGLSIQTVNLPGWNDAVAVNRIILRSEAATEYRRLLAERADDLTPEVREWLRAGVAIPATDYVHARREAQRFGARLGRLFTEVDLLALPGLDRTAPRMAESGRLLEPLSSRNYNSPFNLAGTPALTLPCGFDEQGLPVGIQLAGRAWEEATLLRVGMHYQYATDWHLRRPPLPG